MGKHKGTLVLLWGAAACMAGLRGSPAAATEHAPPDRVAEAAIMEAFDRTVTIDFFNESLANVVDFLKEYQKIEIIIDVRALESVKIATDAPITKSLKGISLRSALDLILRDLGLDWTISNEVLLITSPEVAETTMVTRVYDLGDLLTARDSQGKPWHDFDSVIAVITSTIAPEKWAESGGPGRIAPFEFLGAAGLVVRHTPKVHQEAARLIEDLTELADQHGDDIYPTRDPKTESAPYGIGGPAKGNDGGAFASPSPGSAAPLATEL